MSATNWPNMLYPQPTPQAFDWPNGAPASRTFPSATVSPVTTAAEIREEFQIVDVQADGVTP